MRLERLTLAEVDKHFLRVSQEKHSLEKLPRPWREAPAAPAERHETGRMFCEECFDDWRHGEDEGVTGELVDRAAERLAEGDETLPRPSTAASSFVRRATSRRGARGQRGAHAPRARATRSATRARPSSRPRSRRTDALTSLELRYNAIGDAGAHPRARAALSPLAHLDLGVTRARARARRALAGRAPRARGGGVAR